MILNVLLIARIASHRLRLRRHCAGLAIRCSTKAPSSSSSPNQRPSPHPDRLRHPRSIRRHALNPSPRLIQSPREQRLQRPWRSAAQFNGVLSVIAPRRRDKTLLVCRHTVLRRIVIRFGGIEPEAAKPDKPAACRGRKRRVYGGLARSSRQTGAGLAADLPFGVNIDGGLEPTRKTHPGNAHHSHQTKSCAYQKQFHGLLRIEIILRSG